MAKAKSSSLVLLVLAMIVAGAVWALLTMAARTIPSDGSHGVERHGDDAFIARQTTTDCWKNGTARLFFREFDQHWMLMCWGNDSRGRYRANTRIVVDNGKRVAREITAIIKEKMARLEQVETYIRNSGYAEVPLSTFPFDSIIVPVP